MAKTNDKACNLSRLALNTLYDKTQNDTNSFTVAVPEQYENHREVELQDYWLECLGIILCVVWHENPFNTPDQMFTFNTNGLRRVVLKSFSGYRTKIGKLENEIKFLLQLPLSN